MNKITLEDDIAALNMQKKALTDKIIEFYKSNELNSNFSFMCDNFQYFQEKIIQLSSNNHLVGSLSSQDLFYATRYHFSAFAEVKELNLNYWHKWCENNIDATHKP